jgi:conjugative relaxase-like TrwC/TraI family protein
MALLIWDVKSAADAKAYYASSVAMAAAASRADYYSEGQEAPGLFGGELGTILKLKGRLVDKETFDQLCDNTNPATGGRLTPRTNENRRVCKDFTFSGPKSFSIILAMAAPEEREQLNRIFDESVDETFTDDIEPDMRTRVRIGGQWDSRWTGNALTAKFAHQVSRPLPGKVSDMHRHDHLLVWNATWDPVENRIKASEADYIVRDKGYYEAAFYARLASKLESLGYAIDRRGIKEWEIAGIPQSMIDKFSKRTEQIDAEAERRGIKAAGRKAELGAKIRGKKQKELTMPELRKAWDAQMTRAERKALAAVYRKTQGRSASVTPTEAIEFAIEHLAEKESAWTVRELKRVALLYGLGHVTPDQITAELPKHDLIYREIDSRMMVTTPQLDREEDFIVGFAADGRGAVCPVGVPEGLSRSRANGERLNDGQWAVVTGLLNSSNRINLLEGPGGAGKSWSLGKLDEAMRLRGKPIFYLGTTAPSVGVLVKDGFEANTVAHFLLSEKMQKAARGATVVVDEVSMLGHADAFRLLTIAKQNDLKLILVGDEMQHGSVARGAFMRILKQYGGITPFRLEEIVRQEDPEYRAAAKLLSQGEAEAGWDALDRKGWIAELEDIDRRRHIAADYVQALDDAKSTLVVSPTHAEAKLITAEIRAHLRDTGRLQGEERELPRLVAVDTSLPERRLVSTYHIGDVIQFHEKAKGFKKGERMTVTDPDKVPFAEAAKFQLYRPETIKVAVGEKIRGTAAVNTIDGKHRFRNGSTGTIAAFTEEGIELENGWVLPYSAGHLRHGYVETSFGAQGRTVRRMIVDMSSASLGAINREQLYVSATRGVEQLRVYTDDKDSVRRGIVRSSAKVAALDLRPERASAERLQKLLAKRRRLAYHNRVRTAWPVPTAMPQQEQRRSYGFGR